jgi:hypothetical protein
VVNIVVKSAGVWTESQHTLTRGNKTYAQFVTTLREARPHIQRALEQEQRQRTKKHVAQAVADREKMFEEGSKKKGL